MKILIRWTLKRAYKADRSFFLLYSRGCITLTDIGFYGIGLDSALDLVALNQSNLLFHSSGKEIGLA